MLHCVRQRFFNEGRWIEKVKPHAALVNTDGKELAFDTDKEKSIHFSQLEILWTK